VLRVIAVAKCLDRRLLDIVNHREGYGRIIRRDRGREKDKKGYKEREKEEREGERERDFFRKIKCS
jgi:hypothetical protein